MQQIFILFRLVCLLGDTENLGDQFIALVLEGRPGHTFQGFSVVRLLLVIADLTSRFWTAKSYPS